VRPGAFASLAGPVDGQRFCSRQVPEETVLDVFIQHRNRLAQRTAEQSASGHQGASRVACHPPHPRPNQTCSRWGAREPDCKLSACASTPLVRPACPPLVQHFSFPALRPRPHVRLRGSPPLAQLACTPTSEVVFHLSPQDKTLSIREVEARHIGSLVKVEGIGKPACSGFCPAGAMAAPGEGTEVMLGRVRLACPTATAWQ
jgi:hypothetical protein